MIQDRNNSGLSIKEYCENTGIARHVYYYGLKKVREAACDELAKVQNGSIGIASEMFTELKLPESTPLYSNISGSHVCFEVSGMRLTAGSEYPIDKLTELFRVVSCL
jgi:hypothetical protein